MYRIYRNKNETLTEERTLSIGSVDLKTVKKIMRSAEKREKEFSRK